MYLPVSRVWREEGKEEEKRRKALPRVMIQFDGINLLGCRSPTKEK